MPTRQITRHGRLGDLPSVDDLINAMASNWFSPVFGMSSRSITPGGICRY
jgi:hypothetical protein